MEKQRDTVCGASAESVADAIAKSTIQKLPPHCVPAFLLFISVNLPSVCHHVSVSRLPADNERNEREQGEDATHQREDQSR